MEATRVADGILFKMKQVVDRNAIADKIASKFAETHITPDGLKRSEEEIMADTIAEISLSRRKRRSHN